MAKVIWVSPARRAASITDTTDWCAALASALIAWGLAAMGYVANQAQSDASRLGIVLLLTVVPGVVALLAAWVMRFYPLDDPSLARIQADRRARREAAA